MQATNGIVRSPTSRRSIQEKKEGKMFKSLLIGFIILLSIKIYADPAAPYDKKLAMDKASWDKVYNKKNGDHLKIFKKDVVRIPIWYNYGCILSEISSNKTEPGLILGFVDSKNYWRIKKEEQFTQKYISLCQIKDEKTVFTVLTPFSDNEIKKDKLILSVKIHHQGYIKVYINHKLLFIYRPQIDDDIAIGQIGLLGDGEFSEISISGIAKR